MPKNKEHRLPVLAIDLGGTRIRAAIISDKGEVLARECCLTEADEGPQAVIDRLFSAIDRLLGLKNIDPKQLKSISIAAAGAIDFEKGIILYPHASTDGIISRYETS